MGKLTFTIPPNLEPQFDKDLAEAEKEFGGDKTKIREGIKNWLSVNKLPYTETPDTVVAQKSPSTLAKDIGSAIKVGVGAGLTTARDVSLIPFAVTKGALNAANRIVYGAMGGQLSSDASRVVGVSKTTTKELPQTVPQSNVAGDYPQAVPPVVSSTEYTPIEPINVTASGKRLIGDPMKKLIEKTGGGGRFVSGEMKTPSILAPSFEQFVKSGGNDIKKIESNPAEYEFWQKEYSNAVNLKPIVEFLDGAYGAGSNALEFVGEQGPMLVGFEMINAAVNSVMRGTGTLLQRELTKDLVKSIANNKVRAVVKTGIKEAVKTSAAMGEAAVAGGTIGAVSNPEDRQLAFKEGAKGAMAFVGLMRTLGYSGNLAKSLEGLTVKERQVMLKDVMSKFDDVSFKEWRDKKPKEIRADLDFMWDRYKEAAVHPHTGFSTIPPAGAKDIKTGATITLDIGGLGYVNNAIRGPGFEALKARFKGVTEPGQAMGDAYLKEFGNAVREEIRGTDVQAWIGRRADELRLYSETKTPAELTAIKENIQSKLPVIEIDSWDKQGKPAKSLVGQIHGGEAVDVKAAGGFGRAVDIAGKIEKKRAGDTQNTTTDPTPNPIGEKMMSDLSTILAPEAGAVQLPLKPVKTPVEIGVQKEGVIGKLKQIFKGVDKEIYDGLSGIRKAEGTVGGKPKFNKSYIDARTYSDRVSNIVNKASNELWDKLGEQLKDRKELAAFEKIYALKNFIDADRAGKTTSKMTEAISNSYLDKIRTEMGQERFDAISKAADQAGEWLTQKTLQQMVDAKMMGPEAIARLKAEFPHYLPTEIDVENLSNFDKQSLGMGKPSFSVNADFLKEKKGTDLPIKTDVVRLMHEAILKTTTMVEKRKLLTSVMDDFGTKVEQGIPRKELFAKAQQKALANLDAKKVVAIKKLNQIQSEIQNVVDAFDIGNVSQGLMDREAIAQKQIGKIDAGIKKVQEAKAPGGVKYFKSAETENIPFGHVEISEPTLGLGKYAVPEAVAEVLVNMNKTQADLMTKMMSKYNSAVRAGATTHRMAFALFGNPARDIQTAYVNSAEKSFLPNPKDIGRYIYALTATMGDQIGISEQFKGKKNISEYVNSLERAKEAGAVGGGMMSSMTESMAKPQKVKFMTPGQQGAKALFIGLDAIRSMGTAIEQAPRLAEWIKQEGKMSDGQRAIAARDITVDFQKMGNSMRTLNRWVPFLNANLQGNINLIRSLRDNPAAAARFATATILPEVIAYMHNKQFDNDDKVDEWIKNNYWYFNTGATMKDAQGQELPVLVTIRKGEYATNPAFIVPLGQMVRGTLDGLYGKNPGAFKMYAEKMLSDAPSDLANFGLPPVAKTAVGVMANYDPFRKSEIVPNQMKQLERRRQFTGYESKTSRKIGDVVNISPAILEFVAKGVYPATGQSLTLADGIMNLAKIPVPERGLVNRQENIIRDIGQWVPLVRVPSGRGVSYDKLYKTIDELKTKNATTRDVAKEAFYVALKEYVETSSPEAQKRMGQAIASVPGDMASKKRAVVEWIEAYKKSKRTSSDKLLRAQSRMTQYQLNKLNEIKQQTQ